MTNIRENAIEYARKNSSQFEQNLCELVKIPSVSTNSENKQDMHYAAERLVQMLTSIGFTEAECVKPGAPCCIWSTKPGDNSVPTLLMYGHYDVQPVDPLDLWKTNPFTPTVKGDRLFGRGASDMKGQIVAGLAAIESVLKQADIPLNIKVIFEGEEEIGSTNLADFIKEKQRNAGV
jgi:acetylornithine deacetylase/succinyl-diaminopimelate desuccinylase-like protein